MQGCFIELPAFERVREHYLDDDAYASLQSLMLFAPEAGDMIEGVKDEVADLTPRQVAGLREYLKAELKIRNCS